MMRELPTYIVVPCFNKDCTNQIHLRLDSGYYKFKMYDGQCTRCGIRILIERFSPFLEHITTSENSYNVLYPKSTRINKAIKGDI